MNSIHIIAEFSPFEELPVRPYCHCSGADSCLTQWNRGNHHGFYSFYVCNSTDPGDMAGNTECERNAQCR